MYVKKRQAMRAFLNQQFKEIKCIGVNLNYFSGHPTAYKQLHTTQIIP